MIWDKSLEMQIETLKCISPGNMEIFIKKMETAAGFHYFTGVGKNGHVAAHAASTFNSLGIRSMFVDPVNTMHGEMGIFGEGDIVVAVSKSGETSELITFIKSLKAKGFCNIVAITSSPESQLAKLALASISIPIKSEGDQFGNTVPIASSLAYLAVLQAIAVQISSQKGFTREEFKHNHPGGAIR